MRVIFLGRNAEIECKVSDEDYEFLIQWKWSWSRSKRNRGGMRYAKRTITIRDAEGTRVKSEALYLHHVVLDRMGLKRPTKKHTCDHKNRDKLDCTRENLRWATKRQQEANKTA